MTAIPLMRPRPTRTLHLPPPDELEALGTPETAEEIAARYYRGMVSTRWVLDHHAPAGKSYLGKTAVWFPKDSLAFMVEYMKRQQQRAQARRKR